MWIVPTQISSLTEAIKNISLKYIDKSIPSIVVNWVWMFFTILVLLPFALKDGIPPTSETFWVIIAVRVVLDPIAILLFTSSLRNSEASYVLPLVTLGTIVTLLTSTVVNSEFPSYFGLLGVLITLFGLYLLNLKDKKDLLSPFKHLLNKYSIYMIIVSVLWGLQVALFRRAAKEYNPAYFTLIGSIGITIVFTIIIIFKYKDQVKKIFNRKTFAQLAFVGTLDGFTVLARMQSLATGLATYVSALNRTSIIFSSVFAAILFKEDLKSRIVPILLMIAGVILISFS